MIKKPIFLVGMPAVGKSTLGKKIAQKYSLQFIDLDKYIENAQKKSIPEIFETSGEAFFRKLEAENLAEVVQIKNAIVATGGGTPCFYDNMSLMLQVGKVVFLDFSLELIIERISQNNLARPMFAGKSKKEISEKIKNLY
ncbi:MAG: shikimate kinase, partial [Raineya sp.]